MFFTVLDKIFFESIIVFKKTVLNKTIIQIKLRKGEESKNELRDRMADEFPVYYQRAGCFNKRDL